VAVFASVAGALFVAVAAWLVYKTRASVAGRHAFGDDKPGEGAGELELPGIDGGDEVGDGQGGVRGGGDAEAAAGDFGGGEAVAADAEDEQPGAARPRQMDVEAARRRVLEQWQRALRDGGEGHGAAAAAVAARDYGDGDGDVGGGDGGEAEPDVPVALPRSSSASRVVRRATAVHGSVARGLSLHFAEPGAPGDEQL
jgi:hypothetical protein